jgi:FSR family fosmidomycin resistance protein-like MFS transporter
MKLVKSMSIYSICHFLVDFLSCIFVLGVASTLCYNADGTFNDDLYIAEVIIYNFFAFAFQVPMGALMDKFKIYKGVGIAGVFMIVVFYAIHAGNPILLASIVGIGNGLFHLEGGVNAYNNSKGKAFLNGLFVAPGAMGIFLGTAFHNELAATYWPIALVCIAIVLLFFVQKDEVDFVKDEQEKLVKNGNPFQLHDILSILALIGVSIIVRSIGGSAIQYAWKTGFAIGLGYTICVVLGKMFGGLIGDKFGLKKIASIALAAACVSLILGFNIPAFGFIGIFLFNVPMAITLVILEKCNTRFLATMVGSNTLFLFLGYLICMIPNTLNNYVVLTVSVALAIVSIYTAFNKFEKVNK